MNKCQGFLEVPLFDMAGPYEGYETKYDMMRAKMEVFGSVIVTREHADSYTAEIQSIDIAAENGRIEPARTRNGYTPQQAIEALFEKLTKLEHTRWIRLREAGRENERYRYQDGMFSCLMFRRKKGASPKSCLVTAHRIVQ